MSKFIKFLSLGILITILTTGAAFAVANPVRSAVKADYSRLYVPGRERVYIKNISNPNSPSSVSSLSLGAAVYDVITHRQESGQNLLFASTVTSGGTGRIYVYDINSDPSSYSARIALPSGAAPRGIAVSGSNLYVTDANTGRIYRYESTNFLSSSSYSLTASYETGSAGLYGIAVKDSSIYVSNRTLGQILKIDTTSGTIATLTSDATGVTFLTLSSPSSTDRAYLFARVLRSDRRDIMVFSTLTDNHAYSKDIFLGGSTSVYSENYYEGLAYYGEYLYFTKYDASSSLEKLYKYYTPYYDTTIWATTEVASWTPGPTDSIAISSYEGYAAIWRTYSDNGSYALITTCEAGPPAADTTSPEAITTLSASVGTNAGEVNLTWTAVGDDGNTGTASAYIVKYSYDGTIDTEEKFDAATTYTQSWTPQAAGATETYTLTGLTPGEQIYISIKAQDEVPNIGPLGNCAATIVKNAVPAPVITKIYPQRGPNNQINHIVIEGENLYNDMSAAIVSYDGSVSVALDNVHQDSSTMVQADIPLNDALVVGVYEITITCPGGTYSDSAHENPNNDFEMITPGSDTSAPTLVTNFTASDGEDSQSTLTWTNPVDTDLRQVIVLRKENSYPENHSDASATSVYDTSIPEPGESVSVTDAGLTNGTTYYYAVFSRDTSDNWNDTVTAGSNADTGTPTAPVLPAVIDDFEGTIIPDSGYWTPSTWNGASVSRSRVAASSYDSSYAMEVFYSGVDTGGAVWGGTYSDSNGDSLITGSEARDLTAYNTIRLHVRGDGSSNSFSIILVESDDYSAETYTSSTHSLSGTDWTTVEISTSSLTRTDDSPVGNGTFDKIIKGYNIIYRNGSASAANHYFDNIEAVIVEAPGPSEVTLSLTYHTDLGNIYWVSIPYTNDYGTASGLIAAINTAAGLAADSGELITEIGRWNGETQEYEPYSYLALFGTWSGTNFEIAPGEALYLNVTADTTVTLTGIFNTDFSFNLAYHADMGNIHWVSLPYAGSYTDAVSIIADINAKNGLATDSGELITEIGRWNGETQEYEPYSYLALFGTWSGTNFNFVPGEGYYININQNLNWSPRYE